MFILYGIGEIVNAFAGQRYRNWGWGLAVGILDLVIGFILLGNLAWAADLLPYVVGFILMFVGIGFIGQSSQMQSFRIPNWGWVLTGGILTLIFAFLIIFHPLFGIFNIIVWTGLAFIFGGISAIFYSPEKLKSNRRNLIIYLFPLDGIDNLSIGGTTIFDKIQ
mgnify:CR=1 FL=1